ncbi:hypothetical protein [Nonomuraea sp. NPDC023979]|uniref:hypothetical protein n=1 Tax=Nonomuraea sp. NPDC023979 TaxID=3154796 RepID=UPI0033DC1C8A
MLFIELFVPSGVFGPDERRRLAGQLTSRKILTGDDSDPGADPGVIRLYESLSDVVVHEAPAPRADQPCYVVNVYVAAWAKEIGAHLVREITRRLGEAEGDPERLFREPRALVHVIGVPDGGYGFAGKVRRSTDVLDLIDRTKSRRPEEAPEGMFVDPVCGARVPAGEAVVTEIDGTTYGFCCAHCRAHFTRRRLQEQT